MASTPDFITYVAEQMSGAGEIAYRKMFGEYGFYCDGKFLACVCDNQLFVKITDAGKALLPDCPLAPPYEGASPYFLFAQLEDRELLAQFIRATCDALPMPKSKVKKQK